MTLPGVAICMALSFLGGSIVAALILGLLWSPHLNAAPDADFDRDIWS
jgi:uncharacterized transporter YbjL